MKKSKKLLGVLLALGISLTGVPGMAQPDISCALAAQNRQGTWKSNSKGWWYESANGSYFKNTWAKVGGRWYHFDTRGYMQTGWLKSGHTWYYLNTDGSMVTGSATIGGKTCLFDDSGRYVKETGNLEESLRNNRIIEVDGGDLSGDREPLVKVNVGFGNREYWAYTNAYGQLVMVTAREIILQDEANEPVTSKGRYYNDEAKVPGTERRDLDEGHVIADSLGGVSNAYNITPQNSAQNRHGDQAYMEKVIRQAGGAKNFKVLITYPNHTTQIPSAYDYTYTVKGHVVHDAFKNADPEGKVKPPKKTASWVRTGGKWWYRHGNGSYTKNGWEKIRGKWYHFDNRGYMQTGWLASGGRWYYFNGSGAMQTGWLKRGRTWYYFSGSGAMQTGWLKRGSAWYYFSGSGAMQTGSRRINGKDYFFNANGQMTEQTGSTGLVKVLHLDKIREKVVLVNRGQSNVDLCGWTIVSVNGNQRFTFPQSHVLKPGQQVSVGDSARNSVDYHWLTGRGVWNNQKRDDCRLLDASGNTVHTWIDR